MTQNVGSHKGARAKEITGVWPLQAQTLSKLSYLWDPCLVTPIPETLCSSVAWIPAYFCASCPALLGFSFLSSAKSVTTGWATSQLPKFVATIAASVLLKSLANPSPPCLKKKITLLSFQSILFTGECVSLPHAPTLSWNPPCSSFCIYPPLLKVIHYTRYISIFSLVLLTMLLCMCGVSNRRHFWTCLMWWLTTVLSVGITVQHVNFFWSIFMCLSFFGPHQKPTEWLSGHVDLEASIFWDD